MVSGDTRWPACKGWRYSQAGDFRALKSRHTSCFVSKYLSLYSFSVGLLPSCVLLVHHRSLYIHFPILLFLSDQFHAFQSSFCFIGSSLVSSFLVFTWFQLFSWVFWSFCTSLRLVLIAMLNPWMNLVFCNTLVLLETCFSCPGF